MTSDPSLFREQIRTLGLSAAQAVQQLAALCLSLIAENMELRERQEVVLEEGEEWPRVHDLPLSEAVRFGDWLSKRYPQWNARYFPWDYSDWKASITPEALAELSPAPPASQPQ